MAIKKWAPDVRFSGNKLSGDEIGWDQNYIVINPSIGASYFGTCVGTSTQSKPIVAINRYADYPRNFRLAVAGPSGSTVGGVGTVNGLDQFGSSISEVLTVANAADGGTAIGTKVFSYYSSGTFTFNTMNAGNGTVDLGNGTAGTTTLFGLPSRIGATTDIKSISGAFNGVGTSSNGTFVFGGTPSSAADVGVHAFKAPRDVAAGTVVYNVRYRPSYVEENETTYTS